MTDRLRKAAAAVLDCLDHYRRDEDARIAELRAALAEPASEPDAEPVAWTTKAHLSAIETGSQNYLVGRVPRFVRPSENDVALYLHPPPREWQTLTDKEIEAQYERAMEQTLRPQDKAAVQRVARAIEAALKEKNA